MKNILIDHIKRLVKLPSVAGNEIVVREYILSVLGKNSYIATDAQGNLIIQKGRSQKTIALVSHIDKEGFYVSGVEKTYLRVVRSHKTQVLPSGIISHVRIANQRGTIAIGVLKNHGKNYNDLRVTTKNPSAFSIGDYVLYNGPIQIKNSLIRSSHLDNSLGVAVTLEIAKKIKNGTVIFSALESIGFQGAAFAVKKIKPRQLVVLDTTYATEKHSQGAQLIVGKGPSICIKDFILHDKVIVDSLVKTAQAHNIPYQVELWNQGTSDLIPIQALNENIRLGFVGIPIKNHSTPQEIGSLNDTIHAYQLLIAYINSL